MTNVELDENEKAIIKYFKEIMQLDLEYQQGVLTTARNFQIHENVVWETLAKGHLAI